MDSITAGASPRQQVLDPRSIGFLAAQTDLRGRPGPQALLAAHALVGRRFVHRLDDLTRALRLVALFAENAIDRDFVERAVHAPTADGPPSHQLMSARLSQLRLLCTALQWLGLTTSNPTARVHISRSGTTTPGPFLDLDDLATLRAVGALGLHHFGLARYQVDLLAAEAAPSEIVTSLDAHFLGDGAVELPGGGGSKREQRTTQLDPFGKQLFDDFLAKRAEQHRGGAPLRLWPMGSDANSTNKRTSDLSESVKLLMAQAGFTSSDGYHPTSIRKIRPRALLLQGMPLDDVARASRIVGSLDSFAKWLGYDWKRDELL